MFLVFDVESVGLHGEGFAGGGIAGTERYGILYGGVLAVYWGLLGCVFGALGGAALEWWRGGAR